MVCSAWASKERGARLTRVGLSETGSRLMALGVKGISSGFPEVLFGDCGRSLRGKGAFDAARAGRSLRSEVAGFDGRSDLAGREDLFPRSARGALTPGPSWERSLEPAFSATTPAATRDAISR